MGRIQSSVGLVSGIDTQSLISQMLSLQAQPRDRLSARTQQLQNEQVALTELTALVIGIQISTDRLGLTGDFQKKTATSSQEDVLTATASGSAVPGQYQFKSIQTASTSVSTSNEISGSSSPISSGEILIRTGGFVDNSPALKELRGGAGISTGKIRITDRSGQSRAIDLRSASTLNDVVRAINNTENLRVTASIQGDSLVLNDVSGSTAGNLIVEEFDGGQTAADLGLTGINVASDSAIGDDISFLSSGSRLSSLRDNRGIGFGSGDDLAFTLSDGTELAIDFNGVDPDATVVDGESPVLIPEPVTIGQLLERINSLDNTKLSASIASDGKSLVFEDLTGGGGAFSATSPTGELANDLGLTAATGTTISSSRLQSGLSGPLLSSLNGGAGISDLGDISIQSRDGTTTNVSLSSAETLDDVIATINSSNAGVTASLNETKTGLLLRDTTGASASNFTISTTDASQTAEQLGIAGSVESSSIDSGSLDLQFVSRNSRLETLNQGRGIGTGSFTLSDSAGNQSGLNIGQLEIETVGELIDAINGLDIGVTAQLSESGDGVTLIDTAGGSNPLVVKDSGNGTVAAKLGIAGTSKEVDINGVNQTAIVGSANVSITVESGKSLDEVLDLINEETDVVSASTLNTGPDSVRLLLTSETSGKIGRVIIEGGDTGLNFSTTSAARDAVISIGASESSGGTILTSSSNTFSNVVKGVDITVEGVSDSPVDITIGENNSTATKNVEAFVNQFNKVVDKVKELTTFRAETNQVGLLFGSSEALRVEMGLSRLVSRTFGSSNDIRSITQLGIRFNETGKLDFDKAKFEAAIAEDPDQVNEFFTAEETGFSARAKTALDSLAGVGNSVLLGRTSALSSQIESNNARIGQLSLRLDKQQARLEKQFLVMEQTIAKLQNNLSGLNNLSVIPPSV
jgi:flagellar hook-associated protein 2